MSFSPAGSKPAPGRRGGVEIAANRKPLLVEAVAVLFLVGIVHVALTLFVSRMVAADIAFSAASIGVYTAIAAIALLGLNHHPHGRFGAANTITAIRAALTAFVAASIVEAGLLGPHGDAKLSWSLAGLVFIALCLDGIDGFAARRSRTQSTFGARFDMEVDALLILLLSILAFASEKTAGFVICLGAMRYGYMAIHALVPGLPDDLAPSLIRKAVCVVQVAVLCVIVTPIVPPPLANGLAAFALLCLAASFGRDLTVQFRRRAARIAAK